MAGRLAEVPPFLENFWEFFCVGHSTYQLRGSRSELGLHRRVTYIKYFRHTIRTSYAAQELITLATATVISNIEALLPAAPHTVNNNDRNN